MSEQSQNKQDEISIRELIETVWKGKLIIIIVTIIAILASGIVSFFVLPKKYVATTSISVKPVTMKLAAIDTTVSIVDHLALTPIKTKADYQSQITSARVLENTIAKLGLKDTNGNTLSVSVLSSMITVTDVVNTDRISVTVNSSDPQKAALIANTLSQEFEQIAADDYNTQIKEVSESIENKLSEGKENLSEKTKALNDYRSENINYDLLVSEVGSLTTLITQYKTELRNLEIQVASDIAALKVFEGLSQSTDIITDEEYDIVINTGTDTPDIVVSPDSLLDSLVTIDVYETQANLTRRMTKKEILETRIPELETTLTESQQALTEMQYQYDTVVNDKELARKTYQAYQQRSREGLTYSSSDVGKSIISIASEASIPGAPISPNKTKNIAVAGILGFCLSVLFVLFRNYWKRTKVVSTK